jgi:hypothetical protein
MRQGRKYKGCWLKPVTDGWESLCFGIALSAPTLVGLKYLVTEKYPACLRHGRRSRY